MNIFTKNAIGALVLAAGVCAAAVTALAHGNVTPQPVNTDGLDKLGKEWRATNPYRDNAKATEIGASGYAQNCARCHGIEVISGGIAPDLRYLEQGDGGDDWFKYRMQHGSVRDGKVYMPVFDGVLSQEALWAIRTYIESRHED